jgi:hypothetical protein
MDSASFKQVGVAEKQAWNKIRSIGSGITFGTAARQVLDLKEFSLLLGVPEAEFGPVAQSIIRQTNFEFRFLSLEERELLIFEILSTISGGKLTISGPAKRDIWNNGWSENLSEFSASGFDPTALIPKFIRKGVPKRLNGEFILPYSEDFEVDFVRLMREVLFRKFFSDIESLYEFGCGTGSNLLAAAEILPGTKLYGLDWSIASTKIVKLLGETKSINIYGHLFDMFSPDYSLPVSSNDGVLTIGALEQLGTNFTEFLNFLIEKSPRVCVHFETMNELYDRTTVPDFLATEYSKVRNYLWGFLTALRNLEKEGRVKILQIQRVFGGQFHEGYSFVAWSPVSNKLVK